LEVLTGSSIDPQHRIDWSAVAPPPELSTARPPGLLAWSEPHFSATDRAADVAEDEESNTDDQHDPADRVEQTYAGEVADEEQN
jgi:hypothetical protein